MIFGPTPLAQAVGAILAHTHRLPATVLKKGAVLDAPAIDALAAAGLDAVIAARLEPGDVPEDAAAARLAEALLAPGLDRTRAGTGRVNLTAARSGLLRVDAARVDALNQADESLTLGTLPDWSSVTAGEMVATIKVIPFAVPGAALAQAVTAGQGALALHPFTARRVGLVMTTLPGLKPSILAGTADVTRSRVEGLGGTFLPPVECPHDSASIAAALHALVGAGAEILLVAGASAVVDRRDVGPAGIVAAGGAIHHFGMPVDPGNLICLGAVGAIPALVLPGCARSPKLNGIDWVLARLFAGLPVTGTTLAAMGVGGLLKDTPTRPLPRAQATRPRPQVAAILLAAGRSSRMGPRHKLLVPGQDGIPMVARVADTLLATPLRPIIAVLGHRAPEVDAALGHRPVTRVHSSDYQSGLAASLRAGVAALPPGTQAVLVVLGDMPLVSPAIVARLIDAYDPDEGRLIVAPTFQGHLGNPVLWDRRFFAEILALTGDRGARALLDRHAEHVTTVAMEDDAVLRDIDTPEQLATLPAHLQPVC